MNEKFYALPQDKQDRILNAGFRVFSKNSYKKSPMLEMYQDMFLASEGYVYRMQQEGDIDVNKMVSD